MNKNHISRDLLIPFDVIGEPLFIAPIDLEPGDEIQLFQSLEHLSVEGWTGPNIIKILRNGKQIWPDPMVSSVESHE